MEEDFAKVVEQGFNKMVGAALAGDRLATAEEAEAMRRSPGVLLGNRGARATRTKTCAI